MVYLYKKWVDFPWQTVSHNQMVSYTLAGFDYQWLSIVTSGEPMFYPRELARSVAKKRRVFPYRGELWSFHAWFPSGLLLDPSQNEPGSPRHGFGRWFFSWKCGSCIFPPQSGGRRVITSSCSSNFDVCPGMISQGFHESNVRFSRWRWRWMFAPKDSDFTASTGWHGSPDPDLGPGQRGEDHHPQDPDLRRYLPYHAYTGLQHQEHHAGWLQVETRLKLMFPHDVLT